MPKIILPFLSLKLLHLILLSCFLSYLFLHNLADTSSFHSDEVNWIPHSNQIFQLFFIDQDFQSPIWSDPFYYYGSYNPPMGKYLVGFGTYIFGHTSVPKGDYYNWDHDEAWNIAQGNIPDSSILWSARFPIALTGIGVCLILFLLIQHFYSSTVSFLTIFILIAGRLFWIDARSAIFDVPTIFFQLITLTGLIYLVQALRNVTVPTIYFLSIACGITSGLATGTKFTGGLSIMACIIVICFEWYKSWQQGRSTIYPLLSICIVGTCSVGIFILINPFLYNDTLNGIQHMLSFAKIVEQTEGSFARTDLIGKASSIFQMLSTFSPLQQAGLNGDSFFLLVGFVSFCYHSWKQRAQVWQNQHSILLIWIACFALGITVWLPMAYPRYALPFLIWGYFFYAYGCLYLYQLFTSLFKKYYYNR